MRLLALSLITAAAMAAGVLNAPAAEERGVARPGGAFAVLDVTDPAACMRACAADGLCMAWTYLPGGVCELKAVVPAAVVRPDAVSGLSARAPASLPSAALPDSAPPEPPPASPARPSALVLNEPALLGGPAENALRPRLGGPR